MRGRKGGSTRTPASSTWMPTASMPLLYSQSRLFAGAVEGPGPRRRDVPRLQPLARRLLRAVSDVCSGSRCCDAVGRSGRRRDAPRRESSGMRGVLRPNYRQSTDCIGSIATRTDVGIRRAVVGEPAVVGAAHRGGEAGSSTRRRTGRDWDRGRRHRCRRIHVDDAGVRVEPALAPLGILQGAALTIPAGADGAQAADAPRIASSLPRR